MTQPFRIKSGIPDRSQALSFEWNGKRLTGYQGDTLASALLANGVRLAYALDAPSDKPVLLLWGEENTTAKFEQAEEVLHLLEDTDVTYVSYPGVGHMAVQQAGDIIAVDVRNWLDNDFTGPETAH